MSDRGHRLSVHQFMAAEADQVLSDIVPMARLLAAAMEKDNVRLARARTSDIHETLAPLCPGKLRGLLVLAAVELARLGWTPNDHPDAEVDPDEQLPATAPEIPWRADQ